MIKQLSGHSLITNYQLSIVNCLQGWSPILFLLYLLLSLPVVAQELPDTVSAVVLDSETREPVPYASVYVSPACGTISNYDGEFVLQCLPSDALRITSIGYQKFIARASELPDTVLMKPTATTMRELTVLGADDVLSRLVRKMQKEAKKHSRETGNYFFRVTTKYPGTDELAEAFMSAKSCTQLRDLVFHSGTHGLLKDAQNSSVFDSDLKGLGSTNLHIFLRLAPISLYYGMWDSAILPSDIVMSRNGKLYDVSYASFLDDEGNEIHKIYVEGKPASSRYNILEGTLYVDYKRLRLLRFDGQMRGLFLRIYDNARRRITIDSISYTMHIDYRHDHGFTEVANMSGTIAKEKVNLRYILFNLGEREMAFNRRVRVESNMLQAIAKAGYDSTLWATTDIVKRTKAEERVAFGDSAFLQHSRSNYDLAPSRQEAGANAYLRNAVQSLTGSAMQLHRGLPPSSTPETSTSTKPKKVLTIRP